MRIILAILVTISIACPNGFSPVNDGGTQLCFNLTKIQESISLSEAMLSCQEHGKDTRLANLEEFQRIMAVVNGTWTDSVFFNLFAIKGFIPIGTIQDRSKPWFFYGEGMKSIQSDLWGGINPDNAEGESCLMMAFTASVKTASAQG
ncbi:hypothetical protein Ciccas_007048 [Cichlidogyrus casuarinus]|uniref:C-type lectin domain-containing protein n=1 Tax=Cichlidogyrus casuarinus TaxID=1844966 RepID=A0ABD2Q3Z2_9PLAT